MLKGKPVCGISMDLSSLYSRLAHGLTFKLSILISGFFSIIWMYSDSVDMSWFIRQQIRSRQMPRKIYKAMYIEILCIFGIRAQITSQSDASHFSWLRIKTNNIHYNEFFFAATWWKKQYAFVRLIFASVMFQLRPAQSHMFHRELRVGAHGDSATNANSFYVYK